ncbi:MAG: beta-ketoacyl-ACP synthase II [Candidatus Eisenbacteria bacterium]
MDRTRVVVTGMGAITSIGLSLEEFWKNCLEGKNGIDTITHFDPEEYASKIAGEIKGFNPEDYVERVDARKMDRFTQLAVACSDMAIKDAALDLEKEDTTRIGVLVGAGIGGIGTFETQHSRLVERGPSRVSPFFVPMMILDMAPGLISIRFGLKGPNFSVVSACASGAHAIGEAFRILQRGDADAMVVGGAEAGVTPMTVAGFSSMKALSTRNDEPSRASRPFDKDRDGFVLGEGAGMFVLETMEHAVGRNARIYAELVGYGATADAYHMTAPAPDGAGAARSMSHALADAGLTPQDVSYINAHGTSTPHNDRLETLAIKTVFGDGAYKIPVVSTKSMIGHLLGAAGAVELQTCVLSIRDGKIHPTINHEIPDPDCDLDYVPGEAREATVNVVLSNSFGFGGHNATLIVKAYEG